jgi:ADP-ribose pyrophosphatase YjhB (NUDIX family)
MTVDVLLSMTKKLEIQPSRVPDQGHWNVFHDPRPYVTVSGVAFDQHGNFPVLFRSDKVRSAKNAWAIPSGLHEVGFTLAEQFNIELDEELGLQGDVRSAKTIGVYENIATIDSYHWVIIILTMRLAVPISKLVNKEPDKHSTVEVVNYMNAKKVLERPWAPHLGDAMHTYYWAICQAIESSLFPKASARRT